MYCGPVAAWGIKGIWVSEAAKKCFRREHMLSVNTDKVNDSRRAPIQEDPRQSRLLRVVGDMRPKTVDGTAKVLVRA